MHSHISHPRFSFIFVLLALQSVEFNFRPGIYWSINQVTFRIYVLTTRTLLSNYHSQEYYSSNTTAVANKQHALMVCAACVAYSASAGSRQQYALISSCI
jgi:hypothetical protein